MVAAFHVMIRRKGVANLDQWIDRSRDSLVASFVSGIVKDIAAVRAAIALPWSNGQTEGQITKLKLVKRQMYGRAKIDSFRRASSAQSEPLLHQICVRAKIGSRLTVEGREEGYRSHMTPRPQPYHIGRRR
jgi:hypothetical protein